MKSYQFRLWSTCLCTALTIALPLHAATLTVINTDDTGPGSLRQILADSSPADVIEFDSSLAGSTIILTNGELLITNNLTITGLGTDQLTISAGNTTRVLHLSNNVTVTITGLTLTGGLATPANGGAILVEAGSTLTLDTCTLTGNTAPLGGAVANLGTTTITNCLIHANTAPDGGGALYNEGNLSVLAGTRILSNSTFNSGGALFNATGTLLVELSTIASNTSGFLGGNAYNDTAGTLVFSQTTHSENTAVLGGDLLNAGTLTLNRVTSTGNRASLDGGAIYNAVNTKLLIVSSTIANNTADRLGGALVNYSVARLAESTIAGNTAPDIGGLALLYGEVTIDNTILANGATGGNYTNDGTVVTSLGHNLSDDSTTLPGLTHPADLNNTPAGLDPAGLQNNGGTTATIALTSGSAAIGAGGPVYIPFTSAPGGGEPIYPPFTDQRGLPRFGCGKMDIGAFQTQDILPPVIALIGDAVVTNECPTSFTDPGATASTQCGNALAIAAGGNHSVGLRIDGTLAAWGDLTTLPGGIGQATAVAAGNLHNLALQEDGQVFAWGDNTAGQTDVPSTATNAIAIAAGGSHSLALRADGTVLVWGDSDPVPPEATNVVAIAAGASHSLALLTDGTILVWGDTDPAPAEATNVVAIAAGELHSLALRADGTVVVWGDSDPAPAEATNIVAIAAGNLHSLALRADGTVIAWGDNTAGQTDIPAVLENNAAAIAAGAAHSLAITRTGAVVGWGLNGDDQTVATADLRVTDLTGSITQSTVGTTNGLGSFTRTYTVVDINGATSSVARTVVTLDTSAPAPDVSPLPSLTNACSVTLTTPTATDACAGEITGATTDPTSFNLPGTFLVTWTYADLTGNIATQVQTVVIDRVSPPAIVCPGNLIATNAAGQCSAVVNFTAPVVTPDCPTATTTQIAGLPSGSTFPVGVTTNTFQVVDASNNTNTCSFTVTVVDLEAPTIACPANIVTNTAPGQCVSAPITFAPTVGDNCPGATVVSVPPSGSTFAKGTNIVTSTVTDAAGNTNSCSFTVTVLDLEAPTIACPANIVTNTAPGQCVSEPITFAPTVGDNCPGATVVSVPPSGSTFAKGTNIVTSTVTDDAGNTNSCSFTIIVVDQEAPTITCPATIVTNTAPGQCVSAPITFAPTVGDNCPGTTVVSVPPSGSTFAKGTNIVTSTVTDAAGNTNSCSFTVIVVDQEAPTITCPANIVTTTTPGQCVSAPVTFTPTVGDNCPGTSVVSVPPSGSTFAKGTNIVTSTVTDAAGNTNSCSFTVIVVDQEAPTITCPANIVTTTTPGQCVSAPITFAPTVGDNCPGATVVSVPPSGSTFAKGTNIVTSTVTDVAGNTNSCSFTVIVVDQEAPTITCPTDIITNATSAAGTVVTFAAPVVSDNCPGVTISNASGSLVSGDIFPIGTTMVTRYARDAAGNVTSCSFTVTVGGPRDDFDTARAEIQALRDETTDPAELKQLDRVLTLLTLSDTYWDDEVNLDAKDGKKVFSVVKTTIKTLEKFIAKSPNLPDAPMQAVIDRLVAAGRVVANLAITEATSAGADPAALAKANAAYAAGLWEINNGTPGNANKYLQKAWTLATKALAKLD